MVVFGQSCCIRAKWLYPDISDCNRHKLKYSGKVVVFEQKWLYSGIRGCIRAKWLFSGKVALFLQSGCNRTR